MKFMQFLSFEITSKCDLGKLHKQCPVTHPERYAHVDTSHTLNDEMILEIARKFYRDYEFRGLVGWHYYNEPLLEKERIFALMYKLREEVPESRFVLWTNGNKIPQDCSEFAIFDQIWISNYFKKDFSRVQKVCPNTNILPGKLDTRLTIGGGKLDLAPCVRPYTEFIVDQHGNVHICCMDWKGKASPGNVYEKPLDEIVAKFQEIRANVSFTSMLPKAPEVCKHCQLRYGKISDFDPRIQREAQMHRDTTNHGHHPARKTAVVFTSYKVPTSRLDEHFRWNDALYRRLGLKVYVVTDQEYPVPDYAECVVYKEPMPVFNLSKTSNFGVQHAVAQGFTVVIKSDVDIVFPDEAMERMVRCLDKEAIVPLYLMAVTYKDRRWNYVEAPKAEGTIAMAASNWKELRYQEKCEGYGSEDGIMIDSIERAVIHIHRGPVVWHIAHIEGTPQKEKKGRHDHWNRDTGFNPDNTKKNLALHPKKAHLSGQTGNQRGAQRRTERHLQRQARRRQQRRRRQGQ